MGDVYFADTFYWVALANPKDAWHSRVVAWERAHPSARFVRRAAGKNLPNGGRTFLSVAGHRRTGMSVLRGKFLLPVALRLTKPSPKS